RLSARTVGARGARRLAGGRTRRRVRPAHWWQVEGQRLDARELHCGRGLLAGDLVIPVVVLVVAKAPVPGQAKTRLAASVGDRAAADIAAAALLDTLDAVADAPVAERVVALTGSLDDACGGAEIRSRLADFTVVPQRGPTFADRLANAHADAAAATGGLPVLQIGMDTPQVTSELIGECARELLA